ncbi:MAG: DEAD/DEAH box helicase family protein [Nitrosomonadales bacterium]|nr:DEAD/DEAH box helicase family protein [Nitrosomonadales bacterium]
MNEAETRAEHIDPALKAAGWGVVEGSRVMREYRITEGRLQGAGQRSKPEIADYVLVYRNHKLAVVEAKRWDLPYTEGLGQAKQYAGKIGARFTYATNGLRIYGVDMQSGAEGDVDSYPSPEELWNRTFVSTGSTTDEWRERFAAVPFEDKGGMWGSRYYQDSAINNVLEAIADNQQRILLTLATGTGKTFIAFQLAWKLFKSRWNQTYLHSNSVRPEPVEGADGATETALRQAQGERSGVVNRQPRILFLADRNILADQAYNSFSAFPEDALVRIAPDDIRKKGRVPKNGSVFFTIFQTFMSGQALTPSPSPASGRGEPTPYFGEYPPDFFDFIIIDECHRGGANDESTWRGILEYFAPAVQLGLTATPKRRDNADTYAYFGEPVYVYSLKEGINDGFLTPFRVKQYATTLDEYRFTSDDNLIEGEIEAGKLYEEKDFNRTIEIEEREKYRVKLFMAAINQREKTLVFCANQAHAALVRDLTNQMKSASTDPNYCVRVTANDGERGEQYLRDFQDNEKSIPTILTTSQKLSTGVDARNVRNIVLMRPVNSMIEFKQIIGRGTRLYDGKDYFTIYDFVKAHKLFNDPEWDGEPIDPEVCKQCNHTPCVCVREPPPACYICGKQPCRKCGQRPCACKKVRVKLRDGKERSIQHISVTTFWGPDGKPISAAEFLTLLFGQLPEFFKDEDELRALWSLPDTRKKLLEGLAEKGFGRDQLGEMQKIIDAENSDLFDVLAHVAFAMQPVSREERASAAHQEIHHKFSDKQQAFLDFVLAHYVQEGVDELEQEKLAKLLRLKYHDSIPDAVADLGGDIGVIRGLFAGFQRFLYQRSGDAAR